MTTGMRFRIVMMVENEKYADKWNIWSINGYFNADSSTQTHAHILAHFVGTQHQCECNEIILHTSTRTTTLIIHCSTRLSLKLWSAWLCTSMWKLTTLALWPLEFWAVVPAQHPVASPGY
jgi:hypothetical protein